MSYYGVYTRSGEPVSNVEAYAATGAPCFSSNGSEIRNPTAYADTVDSYKSQASDNPRHLYHYTDRESAQQIQEFGKISASCGPGDCALGPGVYATSKAPNCSSETLTKNNWNSSSKTTRTEAYIRLDANKVTAQSGMDELGRNVWKVPGDVDLKSANAKVGYRRRG